jgi:hypothetical protein
VTKENIQNLTSLAGKRIATGPAQSAGFASGELIFSALEIPFLRVPVDGDDALLAIQNGTADAALILAQGSIAKSLHVLPLPLPPLLAKTYQTTSIMSRGKKIETLSVGLELVTLANSRNPDAKKFDAQLNSNSRPNIVPTGGEP